MTVCNEKGFMEKNAYDACSFDNAGALPSADGSITIRFGGVPRQSRFLPIGAGRNPTARMDQPRRALLDGSWMFPAPQPVRSMGRRSRPGTGVHCGGGRAPNGTRTSSPVAGAFASRPCTDADA